MAAHLDQRFLHMNCQHFSWLTYQCQSRLAYFHVEIFRHLVSASELCSYSVCIQGIPPTTFRSTPSLLGTSRGRRQCRYCGVSVLFGGETRLRPNRWLEEIVNMRHSGATLGATVPDGLQEYGQPFLGFRDGASQALDRTGAAGATWIARASGASDCHCTPLHWASGASDCHCTPLHWPTLGRLLQQPRAQVCHCSFGPLAVPTRRQPVPPSPTQNAQSLWCQPYFKSLDLGPTNLAKKPWTMQHHGFVSNKTCWKKREHSLKPRV